jgi:hypothetical protein
MAFNNGPRISPVGINILVDASDPVCYPRTGTTVTNIVSLNTGTITGSVTYSTAAAGTFTFAPGGAINFGNIGNYGTDNFTVEAVISPTVISSSNHYIISKNSGSFPYWGIYLSGSNNSGRLVSEFRASSTVSQSTVSQTIFTTGSNYAIDVQFLPSQTSSLIYVNNAYDNIAGGNGGGTLTSTGSLIIGSTGTTSGSFSGSIYNIKVYQTQTSRASIGVNYSAMQYKLSLPFGNRIVSRLLLDQVPAVAAYSLRKLTGSATYAIDVRRVSDSAATSIGFDAYGDLDTATLLAFAGTGSVTVSRWYDQTGNGKHMDQIGSTQQPQIVFTGSILRVNGKPSLGFRADGNYGDIQQSLIYSGPIASLTQASVYTVFRPVVNSANSPNWVVLTTSPNGIDDYWHTVGDGGSYPGMFQNSRASNSYNLLYTPTLGAFYFGATGNAFINNINVGSWGSFVTSGSAFRTGGNRNYFGYISEIIVTNNASTILRSSYEPNINAYYGIY